MMNYFINKKGFSLIELLISLAILYLCIPPFFNFLTSTIVKTNFSSNYNTAILLGESKLEELMYKNFNDEDLNDRIKSNNNNLNPDIDKNKILNDFNNYVSSTFDHYDTINYNNRKFYIFWNVADDPTINTIFNYKRITIIVFWIDSGKGHKITFETVKREV